jgi:prepilin-type N-terminal cleavage/methylation domain-containing protein
MILKQKNAGFSLIELLIVIATIGLISSIVIANLSDARSKTRDAKVAQDLRQLIIALDIYRQSNGTFPPNEVDNPNPLFNRYDYSGIGTFIPALQNTGITNKPFSHPFGSYVYIDNQAGGSHNPYATAAGLCDIFSKPVPQAMIMFAYEKKTLDQTYSKCTNSFGQPIYYCICLY